MSQVPWIGLMWKKRQRNYPSKLNPVIIPCHIYMKWALLLSRQIWSSRAQAHLLGRISFFGLPAVLAPIPMPGDISVNADFLAGKNAAVILQDELLEDKLLPVIQDLLLNKHKLEAMRAAMKKMSHPNAANVIASQLVELAGEQPL
jgi:UDP-N-acetylglucosamine--N-acetylmuramyl-(pentapeptide) pyrophosphoryl-undecaprenol N-acetylglucosamine transferase